MTFSIAASALHAVLTGGYAIDVAIAFKINLLSLVVCIIVYVVLAIQAKRLKSPVLRVEGRSWLIDSAISLAAVLAMIMIYFANKRGYAKLALYIDPIVTIFSSGSHHAGPELCKAAGNSWEPPLLHLSRKTLNRLRKNTSSMKGSENPSSLPSSKGAGSLSRSIST